MRKATALPVDNSPSVILEIALPVAIPAMGLRHGGAKDTPAPVSLLRSIVPPPESAGDANEIVANVIDTLGSLVADQARTQHANGRED